MNEFEKFNEEMQNKEKSYSSWTWKNSGKEHEHVLNVWNEFEMKTVKGYNNLCSKYVLLLVDVFENFYI